MNRPAAKLLLDQTKTLCGQVDNLVNDAHSLDVHRSILRLVSLPSPCIQDRNLGDIPSEPCLQGSILDTPVPQPARLTPVEKLCRESARPFRRLARAIGDRRAGMARRPVAFG
ncbi:hypothetical protein DFR52_1011002 [Hoeflea marina]|uniref:Uncharacterized protein n=1 Tax=Hoeflea marina TaxID=274592 RepID=A0A317PTP2_9HYPH|nr:hypothetical protein [Hoeflea marina]PWW04307.1 hypothetical protein DFR52_1011002 [Hoeflea marina]